ncbi:hypothetical protein Sste5344_002507 [Sporothrix stenoceras]
MLPTLAPATPLPPTPSRKSRSRRILQACENCRRKKQRCPGERPYCSSCRRLGQTCRFPEIPFGDQTPMPTPRNNTDGNIDPTLKSFNDAPTPADQSTYIRRLEDRLARLEERLEDKDISSRREETHGLDIDVPTSPAITVAESVEDATLDAAQRVSAPTDALTFTNERLQSPAEYNNAARRIILEQVAASSVDLATLQALCLLSFSNLVLGDLQLASFHVGLAGSLMQSAGLDTHLSSDRTPLLESQRRLFWSVQTVAVLCGLPTKIPSTYDLHAPFLITPANAVWKAMRRPEYADEQAPLLPLDPGRRGERGSIWAHMVRSASLWGLVRAYVGKCCTRRSRGRDTGLAREAPWQPDSDYTAINAQLLDMEGAFPVSFRYDASRFLERSTTELRRHSAFWLPWMKIQVTYHTLHAVLNHPFLYSPRVAQPRPPPGPNAFWKTSTDLALLHSTWIARLLGMATHKELTLSDPFFGYAAAVGITLHMYWSRVADPAIRSAAEKYIDACRIFVGELAQRWPVCRSIEEDVDKLMHLSASTPPANIDPERHAASMADNVALLWRILDFAAMHQPNAPMGQSLFEPSFSETLQVPTGSPEPMHLQDPEVASPPEDFQTSLGDYAAPPDWFAPPGQTEQEDSNDAVPSTVDVPLDLGWTSWDSTNMAEATAMLYDPFAQLFSSRGGPDYSRWWDGNL